MDRKISIIVPAYNEEASLDELYERLIASFNTMKEKGQVSSYEIWFINDGSKDNTEGKIEELISKDKNVHLISFRKKSEDLLSGDYKLIENSKYVTEYKRGGLYIILNHSNREVRREIKGEILLSSEKERKNGMLKPWEAIIMRRKYE